MKLKHRLEKKKKKRYCCLPLAVKDGDKKQLNLMSKNFKIRKRIFI